jgi:transposase
MSAKIYVRAYTEKEREEIETRLRNKDSFVLRRSQILFFSAEGLSIDEIAQRVGYHRETVRLLINAFNEKGVVVLKKGSKRPHNIQRAFSEEKAEKLKELIHHSPREFEKPTGLWTLALLAEISFAQGLTEKEVSDETIRQTLKKLGVRWKRAKKWLSSPDPHYAHKKNGKKI